MPRTDLSALSPDDLVSLTNRGTVNRARREVEEKACTGEVIETTEGDVTVKWSDGIECHLPAGVALRDARCSCAAISLCRHLVRSVLLYQQQAVPADAEAGDTPPTGPWDPGTISDEDLAQHFRPAQMTRAREQFEQGLLVELVRSGKPSACFHLQACLLRFLVPGDVRYTHCDCGKPAPCGHVPLAVWAFRQLSGSQQAGIISTGNRAAPVPAEALDAVEETLLDYCEQGVSGVPAGWKDQLARLRQVCEKADLMWPAEIIEELAEQQDRYNSHDARFAPDEVAALMGELLIRCDAIRNDTGALPQLLIRGTSMDRATALGSVSFIGLGCAVRSARKRTVLTAYLQDTDSGTMTAVEKEFPEDDPTRPPRAYADMALSSAVGRSPFVALGTGRLTIQGGKRTARHLLQPGRAKAGVMPQRFEWEMLKAPVLAEDFADLQARLSALPPSSLRPRRVAEDFHVCIVNGAEGASFDVPTQMVRATLLDTRGEKALLQFPYTSRGRPGAEALLGMLSNSGANLRFISGRVRRGATGLLIEPACLVFQEGPNRVALQPWVESRAAGSDSGPTLQEQPRRTDLLTECLQQIQAALEELLVLGLARSDAGVARVWKELQQRAEATGLARVAVVVGEVAQALEEKTHVLRWDWRAAGRALLKLAVLLRLIQDVMDG
jgi:hypothetical protein